MANSVFLPALIQSMLRAARRFCPQPQPRVSRQIFTTSCLSTAAANALTGLSAFSGVYSSRTHDCGALRSSDAQRSVVLAGWILPERKISNSVSFFSVRDQCGTTQLVLNRDSLQSSKVLDELSTIPTESVVLIHGSVRVRPEKARRKNEPTGEIEVLVKDFTLLNPADPGSMPFLPSDTKNIANDELRARFRHLDLRRRPLTENLRKRSLVAFEVRDFLHDEGFTEVETPMLLKSTPEGAREFLVPTRLSQQGQQDGEDNKKEPRFYSLAQSPQQPKQLLICSGVVDKYFQIARCFRDEDGRKDRQPEFTQIDLEMAFVSWGNGDSAPDTSKEVGDNWRIGGHEVRNVVEALMRRVWTVAAGSEHGTTFPRSFPTMTYSEAMARFGSDKPDTRFGLEISDMTPLLSRHLGDSISSAAEIVEYFVVRGTDASFYKASGTCSTELLDGVEAFNVTEDNKSTWLQESDILRKELHSAGNIKTFCSSLDRALSLSPGDSVWMSRRKAIAEGGATNLGKARLQIAQVAEQQGTYVPPAQPHFLWVTEFPLFTRADDDKEFLAKGRWSSSHHPFTAPMWQDVAKLYSGEIGSVRGQHYDLVLNGVEIGGGSVRVHDPQMQEYIFDKVLQLSESEKDSFGHLLHTLRCGAPPHGGIALGFDRLMAMLCGAQTIRDVIAFPKTGAGTDPFFKSPSAINDDVLMQYGIKKL